MRPLYNRRPPRVEAARASCTCPATGAFLGAVVPSCLSSAAASSPASTDAVFAFPSPGLGLAGLLRRSRRACSVWVRRRGLLHSSCCTRDVSRLPQATFAASLLGLLVCYRTLAAKARLAAFYALLRIDIFFKTWCRSINNWPCAAARQAELILFARRDKPATQLHIRA